MDFDLSKENIQPLRGGRNVSQLEVALQAQSDVDLQQELLQQKGAFEESIRTYAGDDPLDNWYNYISWVEQSYPKHGHEGNLGPLLEDCLSKFENDERYIHDRRFCKLWIKYIDLQQNPLELFQLLYSKGICKSCADLYRAWAYYHEAASDFKKADIVFQLGLGEMAQPYEELVFAHKNMYEAFGRHSLQGVDERRLIEQRQALTSLKTYKHNHRTVVPSVRVGSQILHSTPGSLQQNVSRQERNSNVPVSLYEDTAAVAGPSIGGASAVISILDVAKKQEVQKENTLKPGTWKKSIITKKLPHNHVPSFTVHEDEDQQFAGGIRLPPNFSSTNQDDFSTWVTDLYFPEPHDPRHVPMYPKHLVYAEQPNKEYSLEEVRARKWFAKKQQQQQQVDASVNMQETMMEDANIIIQRTDEVQQAVDSILHAEGSNAVRREQLEPQSPVIVQNFSQNLPQNDSHFMPQNTPHFGLPKHPEQRQSILPIYNHQDHFNPDMFVQSYMPTNISGFHLANSTKNPDAIYQPSDTTINNCAEQFHQAVSGPSVSFVFHQNFPQDECSMRALANTSERFMTQNNSAERFMPQNNSVERFMGEQNTHSVENQSASRQMYHQTSHLDKSGMYQPHNQVSQPVSVYEQNASSSFINSSAKMYQASEPSVSYHQNVSNYEQPQHHSMQQHQQHQQQQQQQQQRQQQQQWLPNNGAVMQKVHEWPNATSISSDDNYTVNMREAIKDINEIWKDNTTHIQPSLELKKPEITKFQIHEDTKLQDLDSKPNTGVKRSPFAIFSDEDETHSSQNKSDPNKLHFSIYEDDDKQKSPPQKLRSNMRAPFSSQSEPQFPRPIGIPEAFNKKDEFVRPAEVKKLAPFPVYEDENAGATGFTQPAFDDSCTTQTFNINLNQLKASTPFNYKKIAAQQFVNANNNAPPNTENTMRQSKKVLFDENQDEDAAARFANKEETREEKLSVIFEKSNESRYSSSSSSSGTTLKTTTFHRESLKVIPEASYNNEDSMAKANSLQKQLKQQPDCFTLEEKQETIITSSATTYDVLKMFLMKDDNSETSPMKEKIIDLTHDDSGDLQPFKLKERGAGDAPHLRPSAMTNYVSPVKNLFREMSCDSNDSFSSSPTKGSRMEVDINSLINSNSEYQMEQETQDIPIEKPILSKAPSDPFSSKLITTLLTKVGFSRPKYAKHYFEMQNLPRLIGKKEVACFNDDKYLVEKVVGKGAFGSVYKAVDLTTNELVALKLQKPANKWEYYITKEVQDRITNPYMKIAFMDVTACYVSPTASVLVSQFHKIGSLLDITNKVKQMTGKGLKELISIYYASEIITIVNTLHQCKIIHADIKPDNFLVTKMPPEFGYPSLQLIDFGSSIDMSLFPDGTSFKSVVNTENFVCTEMKDGRPWTYQTDIFCVAATIHVLLFDKYMQVQKSGSAWSIAQRIPRYLQTDLWKSFFFEMLNIESCDKLPNLNDFKLRFEEITSKQSEELQMEMKLMANSVLGR